jgi:hypothetical protein
MINFIVECMGLVVQVFLGGIFWSITIVGMVICIYWIQYLIKGESDGNG